MSIYTFSQNHGSAINVPVSELGGKGYGLQVLASLGIPVPAGVTIGTSVCRNFYQLDADKNKIVSEAVKTALDALDYEEGEALYSVRSGAPISMPGMMDTILNVGMPKEHKDLVGYLDDRAAWDCRRRYIQMMGSTAFGIPEEVFEKYLTLSKEKYDIQHDSELDEGALSRLCSVFEQVFEKEAGISVPYGRDGFEYAVRAVFNSWYSDRAKAYRKANNIDDSLFTAVTIQKMVFGNRDDNSCSGVYFSRDPSSGKHVRVGEYLVNAQGEDVVAGIRTPASIWGGENPASSPLQVELDKYAGILEDYFKDVQDIEFTVESGQLYLLQTRNAKRSFKAACKIAQDFLQAGLWDLKTLKDKIPYDWYLKEGVGRDIYKLANEDTQPIATGLPAGGHMLKGYPVSTVEQAKSILEKNEVPILVKKETSPEDIELMLLCGGAVTLNGGITSHAAVVGRSMGLTTVVGASDMLEDLKSIIAVDGETGKVYHGDDVSLTSSGRCDEVVDLFDYLAKVLKYATPRNVISNLTDANEFSKVDAVTALQARDVYGSEGMAFFETLGVDVEQQNIALLSELEESTEVNGVELNFSYSPTEKVVKHAQSKNMVAKVNTLHSLDDFLKHNGKVDIPDTEIEKVFGTKTTMNKVLEALEKTHGITWEQPEPVLKPRVCFEFIAKEVLAK